jgi:hypothetical protein
MTVAAWELADRASLTRVCEGIDVAISAMREGRT